MKCFKCGYPVLPKYKVCPHCGTTLTENQPVAASGDDSEYNAVSFNNSVKETINPIKSIYAMQCPKCGNIITKAGQKFCTKCGTALTTSQANNESQQKISPVDETGKKDLSTMLRTLELSYDKVLKACNVLCVVKNKVV